MPSPEALAPSRYRLFDLHCRVAVADNLGLAARTGSHHELLSGSRCASGAVAG